MSHVVLGCMLHAQEVATSPFKPPHSQDSGLPCLSSKGVGNNSSDVQFIASRSWPPGPLRCGQIPFALQTAHEQGQREVSVSFAGASRMEGHIAL